MHRTYICNTHFCECIIVHASLYQPTAYTRLAHKTGSISENNSNDDTHKKYPHTYIAQTTVVICVLYLHFTEK